MSAQRRRRMASFAEALEPQERQETAPVEPSGPVAASEHPVAAEGVSEGGGAVSTDVDTAGPSKRAPAGKQAARKTPAKKAPAKRAAKPRTVQPQTVQPVRAGGVSSPHPERVKTARQDQSLDRKEVFLWPDQRDLLDAAAKRLERARPRAEGERITANTLIRVAVDYAAAAGVFETVVGVSEESLWESLTGAPEGPEPPE